MLIHFKMASVRELLAHSKAAPKHRQTFEQTGQGYGLWLVGDEGCYLMSNGLPRLLAEPSVGEEGRNATAMCLECDIEDPAERHRMKTLIFGGDDGVEFLAGESIEKSIGSYKGEVFRFEISPRGLGFVDHDSSTPRPRRRKRT